MISNAELKRRALEAARRDAEEMIRRVKSLREEIDRTHVGIALDVPGIDLDAATRAEIEEWTVAATSALLHAEAALAARRSAQQEERMVAAIAGHRRGRSVPARPSTSEDGPSDPTHVPAPAWRERVAASVESATASIPILADAADRAALEELARAALSATTQPSAALFTDELRLRVHQLTELAEARRRTTVEAARLIAALHGFDGRDVEAVRGALVAVQRGELELTTDLRNRSEAVAAAARREADRRYTADVIADALADLGYEVEDGFATLVAGRGDGHAARWAAHAVRVRFTGPSELAVRVVREQCDDPSDDQLREDREVEHEFCRDFGRLAARLEARHVQVRITSQIMPGEQPVETVDRLRARQSAGAQKAVARAIPRTRRNQ